MEIQKLKKLLKEGKSVRICKWCRNFYTPKSNFTQYCNPVCSRKARNRREYEARKANNKHGRKIKQTGITLICKFCRTVIAKRGRYRYCSERCKSKSIYLKQYERMLVRKQEEGVEFTKIDKQMQKIIDEVFYSENKNIEKEDIDKFLTSFYL